MRGMLALVVGAGGLLSWSLLTEIDGAVVASGQIAVESRRQAIQHPDGGVIVSINVKDGSTVHAGDPILTLEETDLTAQQTVARRELVELLAKQDRLSAEISNDVVISYRAELTIDAFWGIDVGPVLSEETKLFEARKMTLQQSDAGLSERKVQTEAVIAGRERQRKASLVQLELINSDLATQEDLFKRGLTETSRVSALKREAARLEGEIGELGAGIAEARSAIAGFDLEIIRQRVAFREAAQGELREIQPREAELRERLRLIDTRLSRLTLRAPMDGRVLGLQVHTVGGVVPAGAEIASIVPTNVPLVLSVEIDPGQIDRVRIGQDVKIRFPNFNARTTPEVDGQVLMVSADAYADAQTGRKYFQAELSLPDEAKRTLSDFEIIPGMPIEAFIRTDARTPASFIVKPLADYWAYAMREE